MPEHKTPPPVGISRVVPHRCDISRRLKAHTPRRPMWRRHRAAAIAAMMRCFAMVANLPLPPIACLGPHITPPHLTLPYLASGDKHADPCQTDRGQIISWLPSMRGCLFGRRSERVQLLRSLPSRPPSWTRRHVYKGRLESPGLLPSPRAYHPSKTVESPYSFWYVWLVVLASSSTTTTTTTAAKKTYSSEGAQIHEGVK